MCGRFSQAVSREQVKEQFQNVEPGDNLRINFNLAPTQEAYVIASDAPNELQYLTWGLLPFWSKEGKKSGKLINARQEGIETKASFRAPIRRRRCLVLADSFYEWKRENGKKVPYRIMLKDESIMLFAGIWDIWNKGDFPIKSFSIITTPPNQEVAPIHNRMPVILTKPEEQQQWLAERPLEQVLELLKTPEDGLLKMYPISDQVNSVRNNAPHLHDPVQDPPTLFG